MTPSDGIRIQISKPVGTKVTDWISFSVPAALILYLSRSRETMTIEVIGPSQLIILAILVLTRTNI